jgi:NADH-quinone oxidoreductase subunit E
VVASGREAVDAPKVELAGKSTNVQEALTPKPSEARESAPPPSLVAELAASRTPNGPEDLQRIAGIGPRFEAALRKQGITRVSQIAAWSDADLRQAAKALKIPKSRIIKGRWIETARELSK